MPTPDLNPLTEDVIEKLADQLRPQSEYPESHEALKSTLRSFVKCTIYEAMSVVSLSMQGKLKDEMQK